MRPARGLMRRFDFRGMKLRRVDETNLLSGWTSSCLSLTPESSLARSRSPPCLIPGLLGTLHPTNHIPAPTVLFNDSSRGQGLLIRSTEWSARDHRPLSSLRWLPSSLTAFLGRVLLLRVALYFNIVRHPSPTLLRPSAGSWPARSLDSSQALHLFQLKYNDLCCGFLQTTFTPRFFSRSFSLLISSPLF